VAPGVFLRHASHIQGMITAELDEMALPAGSVYSRRPRIRACGLPVVATRKGDAIVCALARRLVAGGTIQGNPWKSTAAGCWR
jgi:hypothetical protein